MNKVICQRKYIMGRQSNKFESGKMGEILRVALPLMLASSGVAIKIFTDRVMLSHYDGMALAASLSSGVIWFTLFSFWLGFVGYISTFVAQYIGANREWRVGIVVWQGLVLALVGGVCIGSGYFWGESFFRLLGHNSLQIEFEVGYFRIVCPGTVFFIMTSALMTFWSGRGKTWMITVQEILSSAINIVVNYVLIFGDDGLEAIGCGRWGIPDMGIRGAAIGTVISGFSGFTFTFLMFIRKKNRIRYNTLPRKFLFPSLFKRIIRFGLPSGIQACLDVTTFSVFIHLLALMGKQVSIASTIAFTFNSILFIPVSSIGVTAGIFVGQGIGAGNIPLARRAVRNCRYIMFGYVLVIAVLFLTYPYQIMRLFPLTGIADVHSVYKLAEGMLHYILAFILLDGLLILYSGAIKGAGDTRFCMLVITGMGWVLFAIPCYIAVKFFDAGQWTLFQILFGYVCAGAMVLFLRYRSGKWEKMKVIE